MTELGHIIQFFDIIYENEDNCSDNIDSSDLIVRIMICFKN
jgi:hypothetical protein